MPESSSSNRSPDPEVEEFASVAQDADNASGLKRKSVRSASITLATRVSGILLQTVSTVVLARILSPADYGIIAIVLSITAFAKLFQDMGLSSATIQSEKLNSSQVSGLFWLNVGMGIAIALVVSSLAPAIAWFFKNYELLWATVAASANFIVASLAVQHTALLKRRMGFTALGIIQIAGALVGTATAIVLAFQDFGYWSLVIGTLTTSAVSTIALWLTSSWRPGLPSRNSGIRDLVRFGAHVTGFEIVNYFSRNSDNLLIGRVWGPEMLGFYSRAYSLLMLPITALRSPLEAVAFPAMSALNKNAEKYHKYFLRYISLLAFASMPLAACLFITSDVLILVLLGEKWTESSPIFSVLAVTAFIQPVASSRGLVLMSSGKSKRYFGWGVFNAVFVVLGFSIGVQWGGLGIAAAYAIVNYAILYPSLRYCFKGTPVTAGSWSKAILRAMIASILAAGLTYLFRQSVPHFDSLWTLVSCGVVYGTSYVVVFACLPGGFSELKEYTSYRSFFGTLRVRKSEPVVSS